MLPEIQREMINQSNFKEIRFIDIITWSLYNPRKFKCRKDKRLKNVFKIVVSENLVSKMKIIFM